MARRRNASLLDSALRLLVLLFLMGAPSLAAFWNRMPSAYHGPFLLAIAVVLVSGAALVALWFQYRNKQRKLAWHRAMGAWGQSRRDNRVSNQQSARYFSPDDLEKFSAQIFKKMGYRATVSGQIGDHGVDVRLINPNGQIELVQCKQWNRPVGEPEVRDLLGAMVHEKAVRGFVIAPNGFSVAARQWAKGKPIILVDDKEINRMVQSAYAGN